MSLENLWKVQINWYSLKETFCLTVNYGYACDCPFNAAPCACSFLCQKYGSIKWLSPNFAVPHHVWLRNNLWCKSYAVLKTESVLEGSWVSTANTLTQGIFTKHKKCGSRQNMWWCTQTTNGVMRVSVIQCGFFFFICVQQLSSELWAVSAGHKGVPQCLEFGSLVSPSSSWTATPTWATGPWWCTWKLAALWSVWADGSSSAPRCQRRSGLGLRLAA